MSQKILVLLDGGVINELYNKKKLDSIEVEIQQILVFGNQPVRTIKNYKAKLIMKILHFLQTNYTEILNQIIILVTVEDHVHKKIHYTEINIIIIILV